MCLFVHERAPAAAVPEAEPVAISAQPASAETNAPSENTAQVDRGLREEQMRAARRLYENFPRSAAAFVLGTVCHEQGDVEAAIRYWEEEVSLDPGEVQLHDRAEALSNLGEVYTLKGEYGKAEERLKASIGLQPRRQETLLALAHLSLAKGNPEDCLRTLDEGKCDTWKAFSLRGQASQRLGNLPEAKRHYESAVRINGACAEAYYGLALTCARLGDPAKADEYRQTFSALQARQQTAGRELRARFNPLLTTRQSFAQTHTQAGWVYQVHGQPAMAEEMWRRAATVDPDNTGCRFHLLMLYQKAGRNEEALRMCQEMIRAEPTQGLHYIGLGNLYARLLRMPEAEAAFRQATVLAPDRPEPHFALAQFYLQNNTNLESAVKLSQQAVKLAPRAPHYYLLGRACARTGDRSGALAAIEKACELDPGNPQYRKLRASLALGK